MIRTCTPLLLICLLTASLRAEHLLWYEQPAGDWNQALPVGNGRMGGMVFGNPERERIQLNEDSMWAGQSKDVTLSIGTPTDLTAVRQLIDRGKLKEADRELIKRFSRGAVLRSHQTLGDLYLTWNHHNKPLADYRRQLDLRTGISTTTWRRGQTVFTQEVFCSNPAEALLIKLTADGPDPLDLAIALDRPLDQGVKTHRVKINGANESGRPSVKTISMLGQVTQQRAKLQGKSVEGMQGVRFQVNLQVVADRGAIGVVEEHLQVEGAKTVYLQVTARTDFNGMEIDLRGDGSSSLADDFEGVKTRHVDDHAELYNRCHLELFAPPQLAQIPTDRRFDRLRRGLSDPGLDALIFHYGRYLLIACSRGNGSPANLQGLWNPHIEAPWNNDYHININLQMSYWPAEVTNLSETHRPVFRWMQRLAQNGETTARRQYGMRGWMAHHASELFAQTVMKSARANWGGWIHGGGWMCQHVWTHYDYTRDTQFLREIGFPLLAGQARFYLDWLVEQDGRLISYPETSPENGFLNQDGEFVAVCAKAAMGQQIITEVFTNTLAAAQVLGIRNALTEDIKAALPILDHGQHIGSDGRLLEWDQPRTESEPGHRHLSHIYGFHPGVSITHETTPQLLSTVRKSILFREKHGSVGVGWSRAWAISMHARFRDGQAAHHHLQELLRTQTLANCFNSVFGIDRPLFQIEANLGATAGVAEMLVQSHGGFIHLLPALPKAWPRGSVKGLRTRGDHTLDISWADGKLVRATLTKGTGTLPALRVRDTANQNDPRIRIQPK